MRNIWLVIKHDVAVTVQQRSFWLTTLIMPVMMLGMIFLNAREELGSNNEDAGGDIAGEAALQHIGLVDEAGFITTIPEDVPQDLFVTFEDTAAALAAMEAGEIEQVVFVADDYIESGKVIIYDENFAIREDGRQMGVAFNGGQEWMLRRLINWNLLEDKQLMQALQNPLPSSATEYHVIAPVETSSAADETTARIMTIGLPYIFYFLLLMGSSYLLRSVTAEKENRTAELLLVTLDPRELMFGKIVAMSVVLAMQVMVLAGTILLAVGQSGEVLDSASIALSPGFFLLAGLFLLLGYLLFAAAMAAAGALAPNAREATPMTWLLILPLLPTLIFSSMFVEQPQSLFTIGLSLFPLSAPSAMVTRLAVGPVPAWQIAASLAGLLITTYLFIVLAARFFRAGNLLSDQSFSLKRLFKEAGRQIG